MTAQTPSVERFPQMSFGFPPLTRGAKWLIIATAAISITIAAHCFFGAVDEIVTTWILSDRDRDRDYHLSSLTDSVVAIVLKGVETGS